MAVWRDSPRWFGLGLVGMLVLAGTACSSTTEPPGEERRPGLITESEGSALLVD